jgi:DNA-binding transcriptional LysR family regulator
MNKFLEMQAFITVVETGSFVKAAEALGSSKPAVSRYLADLESRLGVRLLYRTTRKLSLTEEGKVFFERSKEILESLETAEGDISSRNQDAFGLIKVNAPFSFGIRKLAPLWGSFHSKYPKVELDITLSDRQVDVVEDGFDLAIRIASLENSSLISKKLTSTRIILCASPVYLKKYGNPKILQDLSNHQIISYSYWSKGDEWTFLGPKGSESIKVKPFMQSNNGDTCLTMALAHHGIILQPSFLVGEAIRAGTLVELLPNYKSIELGVYALYPSKKYLAPKVRVLIDHLYEYFSEKDMDNI